jgi:nucleotide-binding universal stress UspA family protein
MAAERRVLVPVRVLEGEAVPESVVDLLAALPVVVLGYHVLPEQTPPGQARMQFEEQAQAKLADLARAFREAGGDAESRLVFTHEARQTFDRVAEETGCDALLLSNPEMAVRRVLVPLQGTVDPERVGGYVAALVAGRDVETTLYHVAPDAESREAGKRLVETARERMVADGVDPARIDAELVVSETPVRTIADAAVEFDFVVMSERAPSLLSLVFGDPAEQVAERSLGPVLVLRRPAEAGDDVDGSTD